MSLFPDGFAIEWDGQIYRPLLVRPHVTKDGRNIQLVDWETDCPSCGHPFTVVTVLTFTSPRRRCDDCKAPGRQVRTDRKLFRKQIAGTEP
jgi:Zn finger protein HypA/HybF involved in hydrogenase expression